MKGTLHKKDDKWVVRYDNGNLCLNELLLHPGDVRRGEWIKDLEITFEIVNEVYKNEEIEFAKLIYSGREKTTNSTVKTTIKEEDYWACDSCDITSKTKGRMCPCPRGGCEAEVVDSVKITTITETKIN